jgi:EmrB/QacA subfamily drug resistance transporter
VITAYLLASTVGAPICGKLGDMYGRKVVLQGAILTFLAGSVVAGLAGSMAVMVAGRALQGLAGGGLIVVSMAVVADVLPPRERGRAQGALGGVFGVSTVIGPLLGGFIVQNLSWHWVFFVNLPVGLLALGVLSTVLPGRTDAVAHRIDYAGAALLASLLSATVLLANMGGTVFPWTSAPILGLVAASNAGLAAFVVVERRACEPILPLSLFGINNFVVANAVGLLVGCAMFGTITFMPLYLQTVQGVSPATSGLFLVPMMAGLIGGSILAGQLMSRTGRYRSLPIASTAVLAVAMLLMSTLTAETRRWQVTLYMLLTGIGIGPVMSVGVAAIQNAVPISTMGVATASANMFRLIGGSLGTSAFGAMFAAGMAARVSALLPGKGAGIGSLDAAAVAALPPGVRAEVLAAFTRSLHPVFLVGAVLAALPCAVSFALRETTMSADVVSR